MRRPMGQMELEQALERIAQLEAENTGLKDEKTALLRKRDELLGKIQKFKKFESYEDLDIDALIQTKQQFEELQTKGTDEKSKYEQAYLQDKQKLESRLAAIEQERQTEKEERERERKQLELERTRAEAIAEFSKPDYGVFSPEQLWRLIGDKVRRDESGKLIVGDEYKSTTLGDHLKELRQDSAYQNQFKASGATGSGANPGITPFSTQGKNPWKKETFNLTEQARIIKENPQQAAALKAAVGA